MKHRLLLLVLVFPMLGSAVDGPKLVCDEPAYDFGKMTQSAVVTHVFILRNEGDTTFVAGMPRATCSCTQVKLSKRMIGPGETAELTAVFTAARRAGEQRKNIYLPPSDSDDPALILCMQGFVERPAESR
ncbi:MAG: DUF1573 domain-containing protein [Kiritimatiellales bacterium]